MDNSADLLLSPNHRMLIAAAANDLHFVTTESLFPGTTALSAMETNARNEVLTCSPNCASTPAKAFANTARLRPNRNKAGFCTR